MAMRAATYVDYDFIPADTTHLKNEGFCVIDHLLGKYKDLEERMSQWIKDNWNTGSDDDDEFMSGLCASDYDEFGCLLRRPFWTSSKGITPLMVQTLCIAFDISHYAYDITRQCF